MTLAERLAQPDVADLPDWQAAAVLNQPDPTAPPIAEWRRTEIGIGAVLDALGADAGASFLDALTTLAATQPAVRWTLRLIEDGQFDLARPSARQQLARFVVGGTMRQAEADALLALARVERRPSWAEAHGATVDARAVGLARGGV